MVKIGKDASLSQESVQVARLRNPLRIRDLNRNRAVQFRVVSQENFAKCPLAQTPDDRVAPHLRGMEKRERNG
jgi:hypothetical protein